MKSIQLTNEQKDKLLEMARTLFPKREWSKPNYYGIIGSFIPGIDPDDLQETTVNDHLDIHWFEFLYVILLNKIALQLGYEGYEDYISMNGFFPNFDSIYKIYKLL